MKQINLPDERDRAVPSISDDEDDSLDLPTGADATAVQEMPDGSAKVVFSDEKDADESDAAPEDSKFLENLADGVIPESKLNSLAVEMLENFERDRDARKKRDEQYSEGIKRTGLGREAPGGADFEGASRAVHPVLIEGCIEFAARSMKELFPPSGPVKTAIIGEQTDSKVDKAERKKEYMNWQLTKQIKEYRAELEQTLTQVPLGGSQYLKIWYDERFERPRVEFIPVDEMLLPFEAADFEAAARKTHVQSITKQTFEGRVSSGLYKAPQYLTETAQLPDQTESAKASNKVEGKEEDSYNADGLRTVFESYCDLELEDDPAAKGGLRGYILTIDETTRTVVGLYRNWREEDERKAPESLPWIVEFGFVPWRGAYKIGLAHIIGGLSGALTGALRSILDGGYLASHAGGLMLKGARQSGKNVSSSPTEFTELTAPPNVDDIRKLAMPFPFPGPSPVIFQLMDWLTAQAKGVVSTASEAIKDAGSDMPVGTALALIEQGSITFSAVHARLHNSQRRVLEVLHRINGQWLDDEVTVEELGELVVSRKDFQGPMDVMPVSDPNIFSDAQRYAQNQAAIALAGQFGEVFKVDKLVARSLKLINYPAYEEVLNIPAAPKKLDAITENAQASEDSVQLKAYRDQDHLKHIKAHIHFMGSPIFCANPMMGIPALPKLLAHVKEHLLALYTQHTEAATQVTAAVKKAGGPLNTDSESAGMAFADQELAKELSPLMPLLQQAEQMAQQLAPQPPMDPRAQAQLTIAQEKIQAESQENDKDRQLETQKLAQQAQAEQQSAAADAQASAAAQQAEDARAAQKQAAEDARSTQEMQVAADNARLADNSEREERLVKLVIEHMKQDAENVRSAQDDQTNMMMAYIKAGIDAGMGTMQNNFTQYQQQVQHEFDLMQSMLVQKNASASDAAEGQMKRAESTPKKWKINRDALGNLTSIESGE